MTIILLCGPLQVTNDFLMLCEIVVASLLASHSPMASFIMADALAISF
jgi:hypothetical protein